MYVGNIPEYKLAYAYPRQGRSRDKKSSDDPQSVAPARELQYSVVTLNETLNLTLSLNSRLLSTRFSICKVLMT